MSLCEISCKSIERWSLMFPSGAAQRLEHVRAVSTNSIWCNIVAITLTTLLILALKINCITTFNVVFVKVQCARLYAFFQTNKIVYSILELLQVSAVAVLNIGSKQ